MSGLRPFSFLHDGWRATALAAGIVLLAAPTAAAGIDFDRLIGIQSSDIPAEFAATASVTVVDTGIDCYALPCPYWAVEDAAGTLLIGVERVVAGPEDDGVGIETRLWQLLAASGHRPIAIQGFVIDRPRLRGSPETQRVLVVTAGPDGLLQR